LWRAAHKTQRIWWSSKPKKATNVFFLYLNVIRGTVTFGGFVCGRLTASLKPWGKQVFQASWQRREGRRAERNFSPVTL